MAIRAPDGANKFTKRNLLLIYQRKNIAIFLRPPWHLLSRGNPYIYPEYFKKKI
jgi:hypothetical protein